MKELDRITESVIDSMTKKIGNSMKEMERDFFTMRFIQEGLDNCEYKFENTEELL